MRGCALTGTNYAHVILSLPSSRIGFDMTLFGERKRREERDKAEAQGVDFWTKSMDDTVRHKLRYAVEDATGGDWELFRGIQQLTVRELGLGSLAGSPESPIGDVYSAIMRADELIVLSILQACSLEVLKEQARDAVRYGYQSEDRARIFADTVRETLIEHRIKYDMIDGKIIEKESEELHAEVVEPVLRLLSGRKGWDSVEKAYQDALGELHNGKPEDAITDACVALEEALALRDCKGNSLSKKLVDARKKGVLAPQDTPLGEGLSKVGAWIEAERSTTGDAHNANPASREDGWLVVHIVGALILRLAEGPRT